MEQKQTVYVLTLSYSMEYGTGNDEMLEVLGVYSNLELAQKMMNNLGDKDAEYRKHDWGIDEDEIDKFIVDKGDMYYDMYLDGWYSVYHECLTIYSRQIDLDVNY